MLRLSKGQIQETGGDASLADQLVFDIYNLFVDLMTLRTVVEPFSITEDTVLIQIHTMLGELEDLAERGLYSDHVYLLTLLPELSRLADGYRIFGNSR